MKREEESLARSGSAKTGGSPCSHSFNASSTTPEHRCASPFLNLSNVTLFDWFRIEDGFYFDQAPCAIHALSRLGLIS